MTRFTIPYVYLLSQGLKFLNRRITRFMSLTLYKIHDYMVPPFRSYHRVSNLLPDLKFPRRQTVKETLYLLQ